MATKDWTNARDKNEFYNKRTNQIITIEMIKGMKWAVVDNKGVWKNLLFKTGNKTLALKFAKQYMRTH